jgi:hypothetical protein
MCRWMGGHVCLAGSTVAANGGEVRGAARATGGLGQRAATMERMAPAVENLEAHPRELGADWGGQALGGRF